MDQKRGQIIIDGEFAVDLDFGSGIFDGDGVWLQIAIRPGNSDANFTTFAPRQTIMPTPYALHAASVSFPLELAGSSDDPIISATNSGAGKGIYAKAAGIYSTAVYGIGTHEYGRGVWGDATGTYGIGVRGITTGDYGLGVYGLATGSEGHGTVGRASGISGRGVSGEASNEGEVENYGGYFVAAGVLGRGVYGEATNTGSPDDLVANYGGYFKAASNFGSGVEGVATGTSGKGASGSAWNTGDDAQNYGGRFTTQGGKGRGVYGGAYRLGDVENYGGYFQAAGKHGRGVYGEATSTNAPWDYEVNYGGYFKTAGIYGQGVYGEATNTGSAENFGGYFKAAGRWGIGVKGVATYASDTTSFPNYGGYFWAQGVAGIGVRASATGTYGIGVEGSGELADFCASGPGIDYASESSIRWKRNIQAIDNPLDKILQVRGVYFDWDADHGGHHDVGMIAEEVGEVMPEIVVYEENGIDANCMDYSKLTPLLVEAVKALKVENDSLKARVEALERAIP